MSPRADSLRALFDFTAGAPILEVDCLAVSICPVSLFIRLCDAISEPIGLSTNRLIRTGGHLGRENLGGHDSFATARVLLSVLDLF